jgi:hypothetical protein
VDWPGLEAHFLGQYMPWDSHANAQVAGRAGMEWGEPPSLANFWPHENLDNAQTGLHDHMMYRKYGYGRGCSQLAVDVRTGRVTREAALHWIRENDGMFPNVYMGISINKLLVRIGMSLADLDPILDRFTNHELFQPGAEVNRRPILKEFA